MEEKKYKRGNGLALKKWRENATEEQLKEAYEKSGYTQRKNASERLRMRRAFNSVLDMSWEAIDNEGVMQKFDGATALALTQMKIATDPNHKQAVSAFLAIRDTIGEKPTDRLEADTTIEIIMSDEMRKLAK